MELNWDNLTRVERAEYMRLQMSPSSYGRSNYYPDDVNECGACGNPTIGGGWCISCLKRHSDLRQKLEENP